MAILNILPQDNDMRPDLNKNVIRPLSKEYAAERRYCRISIIAAVGNGNELGKDGDMIWHIADDLRRFKEITMDHTVIMGRKTWESLPKRPLPGRRNVVVTRQRDYSAPGAETFASLEEALRSCAAEQEAFIIGGGEIYSQAMPLAHALYLTRVNATDPGAQVFFPAIQEDEWMRVEQSDVRHTKSGLGYRFENYIRM